MAPSSFTLDDELSALLADEGASAQPMTPSPAVATRLSASVAHLERFAPHASVAASAMGVTAGEARRALHQLSDRDGWMEIPHLPGVRIRPVTVGSTAAPREVVGALFAEVQPGRGLPRHAHRGAGDETMVVLQGALREVERPAHIIGPGGSILSPEDSEHTLDAVGPDVCLCLVMHAGWADYL